MFSQSTLLHILPRAHAILECIPHPILAYPPSPLHLRHLLLISVRLQFSYPFLSLFCERRPNNALYAFLKHRLLLV
ncbi:hypothetical protein BU26DRAFT_514656 [Trematosphaeria pertusa]|uniref:Uncharacterized protein n=1 Tax=Trematosphaeria pertusa TaxID=390896 RepID=A0A6A6IWP8_9PLEO|nr:uncharacterized protein BU26DRAFT_514656 [Trematosphaeria pertusa]KAF2254814.1 hypothetical protein BU26DRAFT_514656 [Trematosphaeria pertusa]